MFSASCAAVLFVYFYYVKENFLFEVVDQLLSFFNFVKIVVAPCTLVSNLIIYIINCVKKNKTAYLKFLLMILYPKIEIYKGLCVLFWVLFFPLTFSLCYSIARHLTVFAMLFHMLGVMLLYQGKICA